MGFTIFTSEDKLFNDYAVIGFKPNRFDFTIYIFFKFLPILNVRNHKYIIT